MGEGGVEWRESATHRLYALPMLSFCMGGSTTARAIRYSISSFTPRGWRRMDWEWVGKLMAVVIPP